jgi:cation diffusion facilitator CzcD-associated flavoprotein CzcO
MHLQATVALQLSSDPQFCAHRQHAIVVGAGPAGATAAIYLARRGFSVDVFERRPEPKGDQACSYLPVNRKRWSTFRQPAYFEHRQASVYAAVRSVTYANLSTAW